MTDPKYLSDEGSEATTLERELLQAAQGVRLSASEKQAIWAGVTLLAVPTAASAAPSVAPAAATNAALGLSPLVKGVLFAVGLGGLSAGGYWLSRGSGEPSVAHAVVATPATAATPNAPSAASASTAPIPAESAPVVENGAPAPAAVSSAASSKAASASEQKSALADESAAVLEIRRTLRAGDANGALRLLEQARQRFPKGALSQEREALGIEALAKSGASAAAARRAQAFLRAYPKSPYASDVQSFAGQ